MSTLSIIITCLNDITEARATVASIRETAGQKPEIILVDDSSATLIEDHLFPGVKVIHNALRCGVGPSRHIGVLNATGEYVLLLDSHMRFLPGWYEVTMRRLEGRPKTVHCATCLQLSSRNMDPHKPEGEYHGATINLAGPDKAEKGKYQVLEAVWNAETPEDDAEMAGIMGAAYFLPREWFLKLGALRFLKSWGQDEPMLAIKSWLAGGDVRYMRDVRIGHKFRLKGEKATHFVDAGHPTFNKLFSIHTLLPLDLGAALEGLLKAHTESREWFAAKELLRQNWHIIAQERAYNATIFKRDFRWFMTRFGLSIKT